MTTTVWPKTSAPLPSSSSCSTAASAPTGARPSLWRGRPPSSPPSGPPSPRGWWGLFCWAVLSLPTLESFLLGAVIASTDAASVFSILRSKRLNLRDHTASLLEVESGSNDPFSYMLTLILLTLMTGRFPPQPLSIRSSPSWSTAAPWGWGLPWRPGPFSAAFGLPQRVRRHFPGGGGPAVLCRPHPAGGQRLPERIHHRHPPGQQPVGEQESPGQLL
ncbi:MAG: cation:proton antiporter [Evtepia gabavorous]